MKTQTLLKCYIPCKKEKDSPWKILPIEVEIFNSESFEVGVARFRQNFGTFVARLVEKEIYFDFEVEVDKCRFEKITIEEIDINAV